MSPCQPLSIRSRAQSLQAHCHEGSLDKGSVSNPRMHRGSGRTAIGCPWMPHRRCYTLLVQVQLKLVKLGGATKGTTSKTKEHDKVFSREKKDARTSAYHVLQHRSTQTPNTVHVFTTNGTAQLRKRKNTRVQCPLSTHAQARRLARRRVADSQSRRVAASQAPPGQSARPSAPMRAASVPTAVFSATSTSTSRALGVLSICH